MSRQPSPHSNITKLNKSTPATADVRLGNIVDDLITAVNDLAAKNAILVAKLDLDAGVTDTNYTALCAPAATSTVATLASR